MKISKRLNIAPSATLAINGLAIKKKEAGERVYNLSTGQPMIDTPKEIIDAATEAMNTGKTLYTPVRGIAPLLTAASEWMNKETGSNFSEEETFVTNGGKFALYALCQALLEEGDAAMIVAPFWVSYTAMVELAGAEPIIVDTTETDGWKVTPEKLEKQITSNTKLLFLNNAGNPTGAVYSSEEIEQILAFAKKHDVLVISDEVYSGLVYDDVPFISAASFEQYKDNVVIVQSCSKNFAMTGWRVGFVFAQKNIIDAVSVLQGQSTSNTSSISQWAAVAAYTHAEKLIPLLRTEMQTRRDAFAAAMNTYFDHAVSPAAGLYGFLPMSAFGIEETDSTAFCTQALEEGNVALVPGVAFGAEGYVRCSFGGSIEETDAALAKLSSYLHCDK